MSSTAPDLVLALAERGLTRLPPSRLNDTAEEAWAWGVAIADARYCVLWRSLHMVDRWFGDRDDDGALNTDFANRLDEVFRRHLPGVIEADREAGCALASSLHEELEAAKRLAG